MLRTVAHAFKLLVFFGYFHLVANYFWAFAESLIAVGQLPKKK